SRRIAVPAPRVLALCSLFLASPLFAQAPTPYDSTVFAALKWREIGIFRGGRTVAVAGSGSRPNEYWMGTTGGGVFKSSDGGQTWTTILSRNDSTGASDLAMDPSNPEVLYAAFWQAQRFPWKLVSGGAGGGIFKTTDGGAHWTELTRNAGLPRGLLGNIGLAVSPAKPSRVWALIEADSGGVYRSDDGGTTWAWINHDHKLRVRALYYMKLTADPKDPDGVYATNVIFYRSRDGGRTFRQIDVLHGDTHALWIAPNDPQRMILGDDGGATVSTN